jgi:hypothetical protein
MVKKDYLKFVTEFELAIVENIDKDSSIPIWSMLPDVSIDCLSRIKSSSQEYSEELKIEIYKQAKLLQLKLDQ